MKPITDISGERYGRLQVLSYIGRQQAGRYMRALFVCECDCGQALVTTGNSLRTGDAKSCGCLKRETERRRFLKHGKSHSPVYYVWRGMIGRCEIKAHKSYADYGGRGISVCARWRHSYENFIADMGDRPTPAHTLDRINNDGSYEPSNCKWATRKEQNNNRRPQRRRDLAKHGEPV